MKWLTIPEFQDSEPIRLYHREHESFDVPHHDESLMNLHVIVRGHVMINDCKHAFIRISADDYYKLYINGRFIGQGPAPAYPEHYYYNELELTDYLCSGENIIAVHLYYQGEINRVWNSGDMRFGMTAELYCDDKLYDVTWRYKRSYAYSGTTTGYKTQYLENFDSRKWDKDWKSIGFDDHGWNELVEYKNADYNMSLQPIKMLDVYEIEPETVKRIGKGYFIDAGHEITGAVLAKSTGKSGQKVEIRCGEELNSDGTVRYKMRCNCDYSEMWTLNDGENELEPFDYKAFRYAEILCDDDITVENIRLLVRHYPMNDDFCQCRGKGIITDIFNLCKNGVKYGTQEGFIDCPSREKGQYLGDSVVTSHSHMILTGSTDMTRKCIRQFAESAMIDNGIMAVAPGSFMQEIADFSLLFPVMLLNCFNYDHDIEFLSEIYPAALGIVEYFKKYEAADGILDNVTGKWNIVDWPENLRDNYEFPLKKPIGEGRHNVVNALYIGCIITLEKIASIIGTEPKFRSAPLVERFISEFYSASAKLFTDVPNGEHSSIHSNIFPLYFGFLPCEAEDTVSELFDRRGMNCGVSLAYYMLHGLNRIGRYDMVYKLLTNESEHGWVNMLREGATTCYEAWGKDQKWNTSLCHPWGSAPISVIFESGFQN